MKVLGDAVEALRLLYVTLLAGNTAAASGLHPRIQTDHTIPVAKETTHDIDCNPH